MYMASKWQIGVFYKVASLSKFLAVFYGVVF